jgi:hypothetical protein
MISANLAAALKFLKIDSGTIFHADTNQTQVISAAEHAVALFQYLVLGGYLSATSFATAMTYLSQEKPFATANEKIIQHVTEVFKAAAALPNNNKKASHLLQHLFDEQFSIPDIIDFLIFLSQDAFGRAKLGQERVDIKPSDWLTTKENQNEFKKCATQLGVMSALKPTLSHYTACAVMGAAYAGVVARVQDLKTYIGQNPETVFDYIYALGAERELTVELDGSDIIKNLATEYKKPCELEQKMIGNMTRQCLKGFTLTENMLIEYILKTQAPEIPISVINSEQSADYHRATTEDNIKALTAELINKINTKEIKIEEGVRQLHIVIVAHQPYATRMLELANRIANQKLQAAGIKNLEIVVEALGSGVPVEVTGATLTRVNSELAGLLLERYKTAQPFLTQDFGELRCADILMCSKRENYYQMRAQQATEKQTCDPTAPAPKPGMP